MGTVDTLAAPNRELPDTWTGTENVRWKRPIVGRGWSSPVVWGERIFLTAVAAEGEAEKPKPGLYFGGERPDPSPLVHQWKVLCIDLSSGDVIWERIVHEGRPTSSIHLKNSYASETPVTDGRRGLRLLRQPGRLLLRCRWHAALNKKIGPYRTSSGWGTGASPVVADDRLYILNDNEEDSFLLALDSATGDEVWRVKRSDHGNWATPFVWKNAQRTEIIASGSGRVRSYGLDGQQLWELGNMSNNAIPTPFAQFGMLYVCSGHVMGKFKPIVAVRPGASGDITLADGETSNDYIAWCQKAAAPYNPSPILYGDYIYVLLDAGFFACYDAKTGEMKYSKKRIPDGRAFTASPWAYNGQIFCLNEFGKTFVIEAGPEFKLLRTNPLGEEDVCLATPAIVGNKLLLRNDAAAVLHRTRRTAGTTTALTRAPWLAV